MKNKLLLAYKTVFGIVGLGVVALEINVLVAANAFVPSHFFSYLTILSNIFAGVMLLVSAYTLYKKRNSYRVLYFRGLATAQMVVVGILFHILLAGIEAPTSGLPWSSDVFHYLMPTVVLIDWLVDRSKKPIKFTHALTWTIPLVLYLVFTLVRGHLTGWYPYPFCTQFKILRKFKQRF